MKRIFVLAILLVLVVGAGCAKVVGPYYLENKKYDEGIQALGEQFKENPGDAVSAYYVGRYYLALNKPKEAMPYLQKAVALVPDNADYVFWTGVAYWAMLDFDAEEAAYMKALSLDPDHISANLYLGHGYVDRGEWAKALSQYDTVISLDKYNPEALYNRGVALNGLGRIDMEKAAWKKFLEYYPDGSLAMQATERLNLHGDFTYRNFIVGQRNVTLRSLAFKSGTTSLDKESRASLHVLSAMLKNNKKMDVHVVSYVAGNRALAKDRAKTVRDYMLNSNPEIDSTRLPLSWFGTAEKIEVGDKSYSLKDSVQFITVVQ